MDPKSLLAGREDELVARLAALASAHGSRRGVLGIGDDAAVLPGKPLRVVSVDLLVEGQHFRLDLMRPEDVARRALEANLSDIAAMGARPEGFLLGLAWPVSPASRRLGGRLVAALIRAGAERGAPLLGGDTVRAAPGAATLSITVFGTPWPGGPVLRAGGRPGDVIVVTGPLGAPATGLWLLEQGIRPRGADGRRLAREAVSAFRTPRARLDLARPMARWSRALIDLSDGLGLDLPRLAEASRCGFWVDAGAVPVHAAARHFATHPADALGRAIAGGEDYELVAAIPPEDLPAAHRAVRRAGGRLVELGRLTRDRGQWLVGRGKGPVEWPRTGWDPFDARR